MGLSLVCLVVPKSCSALWKCSTPRRARRRNPMSKLLPLCIVLLAASISVSAQTYTVIHNFGSEAGDPGGPCFAAAIAQSRGGLMFTTTPDVHQHGIPAAFRIGPLGSIQVLHQYGTVSATVGGLTLATDGRFYGMTLSGGPTGWERSSGCLRAAASPNSMTSREDPTVQTPRPRRFRA